MARRRADTAFPWDTAMQFGLGVLRLAPSQFWAMTPREIAAAMRARQGSVPEPIDKATLAALNDAFPDLSPEAKGAHADG